VARLLALLEQRWQPPLEKRTAVLASRIRIEFDRTRLLQMMSGWQAKPEIMLNKVLIGLPADIALARHAALNGPND
jgi:hypothetical protein